ncbi:hypothetical protein PIB30_013857 [Stylosanthes scabra]|uniref:Uncharacterized protein n=1 Tax=Stylosanthes scabra TaxID=79078 RepID=A0ABU6U7E8_9FABA|nr:hypothetical protein [Stylosanthes scabra]
MHTTNGNNSTLMPMTPSHTIKAICHSRVVIPMPPSTPPTKLYPGSGEGSQEPSSPLPWTTSLVASSQKNTKNSVAKQLRSSDILNLVPSQALTNILITL